jgi:hypothetical protein
MNTFLHALDADGPAGPHPDKLMLFGRFVGQLRWRFTDIQPDSFTWRGETSHDGGATWAFEEQMLATRVDA